MDTFIGILIVGLIIALPAFGFLFETRQQRKKDKEFDEMTKTVCFAFCAPVILMIVSAILMGIATLLING